MTPLCVLWEAKESEKRKPEGERESTWQTFITLKAHKRNPHVFSWRLASNCHSIALLLYYTHTEREREPSQHFLPQAGFAL